LTLGEERLAKWWFEEAAGPAGWFATVQVSIIIIIMWMIFLKASVLWCCSQGGKKGRGRLGGAGG